MPAVFDKIYIRGGVYEQEDYRTRISIIKNIQFGF